MMMTEVHFWTNISFGSVMSRIHCLQWDGMKNQSCIPWQRESRRVEMLKMLVKWI
jgi:hypothetical protein